MHLAAFKYAGSRMLMVRKTHASLKATGIVTYRTKVLHDLDNVSFFGGNNEQPPAYHYPNGTRIIVGGLDDPKKIMSTEYDMVYCQESTELTLNDWEMLTTRLRNGVMPYQQLIADCNPDAPSHWLKQRAERGATTLLESRHEDNPRYVQRDGTMTEEGAAYIAGLDQLTGVRYLRLRKGIWAAAEGVVYDDYDAAVHEIDRFPIPAEWFRFRSLDFGYSNPLSCSWWAVDGDGRMYRYRQIYQTHLLVEDAATTILQLEKEAGERISVTVCDHDAEDRATLERHGVATIPAFKKIRPGIEAVHARLRVAGDGRPRVMFLRDSLVERDEGLANRSKPTCTEQEIPTYVYPKGQDGKPLKEEPLKDNDHGCDEWRYAVCFLDNIKDDDKTQAPPAYTMGRILVGGGRRR